MGKIRVKTLGEEELEKKQREDAEKRREAKKQKKAEKEPQIAEEPLEETPKATHKKQQKKSKESEKGVHQRGKKYKAAKKLIDESKKYALKDAVTLLKSACYAKFDETVEIHLNLVDGNVKGEVTFPHGVGKEVRVVVADDALLEKIDSGSMDFDILITTPAFMPKLVKYARVLGPKGLMPNPKNGTVVDDVKKAVAKFKAGATRFKAEAKFPLLHMAVGKVSFPDAHLIENIKTLLNAMKQKNISEAYITSTMGPSIKIIVE